MKIIFFAMALLSLSASAIADDWHHSGFNFGNGTRLSIDYTTSYISHNDTGGQAGTFAFPYVNIYGLNPSDKVSLVLLDYDCSISGGCDHPNLNSNQTIVLANDGSKFTGQSHPIVIGPVAGSPVRYFQEVAVVVNGHWYKAQNGSNFMIQMN